jgi:hypothetical protein
MSWLLRMKKEEVTRTNKIFVSPNTYFITMNKREFKINMGLRRLPNTSCLWVWTLDPCVRASNFFWIVLNYMLFMPGPDFVFLFIFHRVTYTDWFLVDLLLLPSFFFSSFFGLKMIFSTCDKLHNQMIALVLKIS